MRLSDLRDKKIRTLDGETLGRVHEVHCEKGVVTALMCGPGGFFERLTAKEKGRRIPWECVRKVTEREVVVTPDPPRRKPSGTRSRQRTPRTSGRQSKR
ncbi:MAG: PRC-barrel domain-containing protein [Bacillota bacterium]